MKLFVGLGNPGASYARHRHNVGFMALERIAERYGAGPWKKRFHGLTSEAQIGGRKVVLLKPQTFMNDSGRSVGEALRYLKLDEGDLYVFHDELDLAPGKLKLKTGGGNAGHNGLRSITAHIGNEYARVRIGIGHPGSKELVYGYVLHDFAKADQAWLSPLLDAIAGAAPRLASGDDARFLTDVARTLQGDATPKEARTRDGKPRPEPAEPVRQAPPERPAEAAHPAGERGAKRASALAENLRRWLKGRAKES
jgi:PTH1 family peptidyl-tRNA hydrolase